VGRCCHGDGFDDDRDVREPERQLHRDVDSEQQRRLDHGVEDRLLHRQKGLLHLQLRG
jgi:hypothetical protein